MAVAKTARLYDFGVRGLLRPAAACE